MFTSPVRAYVNINFFRMCHLLLTDNRRNPFLALFFHFAQENLVVLIFFETLNMKGADLRFTFQLIFYYVALCNFKQIEFVKFCVSWSKSESCTFQLCNTLYSDGVAQRSFFAPLPGPSCASGWSILFAPKTLLLAILRGSFYPCLLNKNSLIRWFSRTHMPKKICNEKITRIIRNQKIFYALGDSTKFQKFPLWNFIAFFRVSLSKVKFKNDSRIIS